MRINGCDNLFSSISAELKSAAQVDKNADARNLDSVAELGKGFGSLIEKALNVSDDRDAVEKARLALADGSLESREALEAAAANIFEFGI